MKVRRLDHAQLTVPSDREPEARAFYLGVLGLPEIAKPAALAGRGGFWTALGGVQVHVSLEDGVDRERTRAHLAYEVTGLAAWRARLESLGLMPQSGSPLPGRRRLELRDPFGNRLELLERVRSDEAGP